MRDQRTKLALKLACLFVFPLELQLVSQSLLRTMESNNFWCFLSKLLFSILTSLVRSLENIFLTCPWCSWVPRTRAIFVQNVSWILRKLLLRHKYYTWRQHGRWCKLRKTFTESTTEGKLKFHRAKEQKRANNPFIESLVWLRHMTIHVEICRSSWKPQYLGGKGMMENKLSRQNISIINFAKYWKKS